MEAQTLSREVDSDTCYEGSHRVIVDGDKVTVCAVSLFCAYDPRLDPEGMTGIKPYTNEKVSEIVRETRKRAEKGQFPRVVLRHEIGNRTVDPTAIARIPRLWEEMRDGVAHIVGDIEMSRADFEEYLLTDAYPRRSAEFEQTEAKYLMNVALLGREAPGRPLEDTRYAFSTPSHGIERPLQPVVFRKAIRTHYDSGVGGGGNVYTPAMAKDQSVDTSNKDDPMQVLHDAISGLSKMCETRFSEMEARMARYEGSGNPEPNGEDADNGESLRDQHEASVAKKRGRPAKVPSGFIPQTQFEAIRAQLEEQRDKNAAMHEQVTEFAAKFRRVEAEKIVDGLIADGRPSLKSKRDSLVTKFAALEGQALKTEFDLLSGLVPRDPVGSMEIHSMAAHLDAGHASTAAPKLDTRQKIAVNEEAVRLFEAAKACGEKTTLDKCRAEARRTLFAL